MTDAKRPLRVFLCHASGDKTTVLEIYKHLVKDGIDAWLDSAKLIPGQDWQIEIRKAIKSSDVVIVCLSSHSVTKEGFIQKEIRFALDVADEKPENTIFIIPARLEVCEVPQRLSRFQWVDLFSEDGYRLLIKALELRAGDAGTIIKPNISTKREVIKTEHLQRSAKRLPSVWSVPHHRNPNFTGRYDLLEKIKASLISKEGATVIQALHGLGGVGKTQLAIEYAYRYANEYSCVWWLRSDEVSTLTNDYTNLGKSIGLSLEKTTDQMDAIYAVRQWLEMNTGWLLIFDNAIDVASLSEFVPQGTSGHTIITSRNPFWGGLGQTITIGTLEREDSISFILRVTRQNDLKTANELAYALGDLPLALAQAASYIEKTGILLTRYLSIFRLKRRELHQHETAPEHYPDTVATTWLINIESIKSQTPSAIDLLSLTSFLGPDNIPFSLLKQKSSVLPNSLSSLVEDDLKFNEVIAALHSYSLLEIFDESISLHRLVQAITRDNLSREDCRVWAAIALKMVRVAFPIDSDKIETWDTCSRLLSHALVSASHAERLDIEKRAASWLFNQAGMYLMARGDYEHAESLLSRALDIADGRIGDTEYDRPH